MNTVNAIKTGLSKSFAFKGRASRVEFAIVGSLCLLIGFMSLKLTVYLPSAWATEIPYGISFLIPIVFTGVTSRRWHDAGFNTFAPITMLLALCASPILMLLGDAGYLGEDNGIFNMLGFAALSAITLLSICTLVALFAPSDGTNKYGPNPNEVSQ